MKKWKITFQDKHGIIDRLELASDEKPTNEEAAVALRAKLFPVTAKADLNDFEGRVDAPTAKWLEEQNSVKITDIDEIA